MRRKKSIAIRWSVGLAALVLFVALANSLLACRMLWARLDAAINQVARPAWPSNAGLASIDITEIKNESNTPVRYLSARAALDEGQAVVRCSMPVKKRGFDIYYNDNNLQISCPGNKTLFSSAAPSWPHALRAVIDLSHDLAHAIRKYRWLLNLRLCPFVTGYARVNQEFCWRIRTSAGYVLVNQRGYPRRLEFQLPHSNARWVIDCGYQPASAIPPDIFIPPEYDPVNVTPLEMDMSLAAICRLAGLHLRPVEKPPDSFQSCGEGWLRVRAGNRMLHLSGTPHELGYQHGKLLAPEIKRACNRVIFGMGLVYSLEKGRWFPDEARKLIERQKPFIDPAYLAEMDGLAEGAEIPLEYVQIANLFPEFFHCSNAAVFGKATRDGKLLLARVLDYLSWVGLQDDAVVMAVARSGVNRFVNVGYAGFIGSVTGMNEHQIAIGEMGGGGEGQWDGIPMSFLLRGALENADTLAEAMAYMRDRRRTCEYYYVIGDAKIPDAAAIHATPDKFAVLRAGEASKRLPDAIPDTMLVSGGRRYRTLVQRVREHYGEIDAPTLARIIKRPVAMRSNLHNAIFAPADLRVWVFNASRRGPACDQTPAVYAWPDMFGD